MRVPIRMLGIATTIFWIFLIAFFATAAYSVKDVHFNFGQAQISITANNEMVLSLNMTIENQGLYNIGAFNLTAEVFDKGGLMLARGSTFVPIIARGEETTALLNMTINLNDLSPTERDQLLNGTELMVNTIISMRIAEVIPVQASSSFTVPVPAFPQDIDFDSLGVLFD